MRFTLLTTLLWQWLQNTVHGNRCGTNDLPLDQMTLSRTYMETRQAQMTQQRLATDRFMVNLVFHIFYNSNDQTGTNTRVPTDAIIRQVEVLNTAYSGNDKNNFDKTQKTDTQIRFRLLGINYIDNATMYNSCNLYLQGTPDQDADPGVLQTDFPSSIPDASYPDGWAADGTMVNVYTCQFNSPELLGLSCFPYSACGLHLVVSYSTFPTRPDWNQFSTSPYNAGDTLTHELGHTFGLLHTFQPWENSSTGVYNGCVAPGDSVDDTPYEAYPYYGGCPTATILDTLLSPCYQTPVIRPVQDFMDYSVDLCMDRFSPGQVERIYSETDRTNRSALLFNRPVELLPCHSDGILGTMPKYELCRSPCYNTTTPNGIEPMGLFTWCNGFSQNLAAWGTCSCDRNIGLSAFTGKPTHMPTSMPSTKRPTTKSPTNQPSLRPTGTKCTCAPTKTRSTKSPTGNPTRKPSKRPTSHKPSRSPSMTKPSTSPLYFGITKRPSVKPSLGTPTIRPTKLVTQHPTMVICTCV